MQSSWALVALTCLLSITGSVTTSTALAATASCLPSGKAVLDDGEEIAFWRAKTYHDLEGSFIDFTEMPGATAAVTTPQVRVRLASLQGLEFGRRITLPKAPIAGAEEAACGWLQVTARLVDGSDLRLLAQDSASPPTCGNLTRFLLLDISEGEASRQVPFETLAKIDFTPVASSCREPAPLASGTFRYRGGAEGAFHSVATSTYSFAKEAQRLALLRGRPGKSATLESVAIDLGEVRKMRLGKHHTSTRQIEGEIYTCRWQRLKIKARGKKPRGRLYVASPPYLERHAEVCGDTTRRLYFASPGIERRAVDLSLVKSVTLPGSR